MVYTYKPSYYSASSSSVVHDTITSLCKSILSFSSKNRRLTGNRHSDNLKWQQESFHRILNLIGLHKEGIVPESEVAAFRTHVLDTLVACPAHPEPPGVVRDKLLFLQELFYAKCISSEQYHSSKRPLLHRLAVLGVEIDARDVIVGGDAGADEPAEEEWSVIDLGDRDEVSQDTKAKKQKHRASPLKGVVSLLGIGCRRKEKEGSAGEGGLSQKGTVLMSECSQDMPPRSEKKKKTKKRVLGGLFQKERGEGKDVRPPKRSDSQKQWGLDGVRRWKRNGRDTNTPEPAVDHLLLENRPAAPCPLLGEGSDGKSTDKETPEDAASSDLFVDKGLVENTKKDAVGEKRSPSSGDWVAFEEENAENFHPNLFFRQQKKTKNPFDDEYLQYSCGSSVSKNPFQQDNQLQNNPFWTPNQLLEK